MTSLSALYFPDTLPPRQNLLALLLLFKNIGYYRPMENPAGEADGLTGLLDDPSCCLPYAPVPLGADLDRFHRALRDLQNRGEELAGQLASLQAAARADGESTAGGLVSELLSGGPDAAASRREALWRARLFLVLAENMERKKAELERDLDSIKDREQQLLQSLKGPVLEEEEGDFSPGGLPGLDNLSLHHDDSVFQHHRLKAWAGLYLADHRTEDRPVLVTARKEAAIQLLDACRSITDRQPQLVYSLPLPSPSSLTPAAVTGGRRLLQEQTADSLQGLHGTRGTDIPDADEERPLSPAGWREALDRHFPPAEFGRCGLAVYTCRGLDCRELLSRICKLPAEDTRPEPARHGCLVAVLGE